MFKCHCCIQNKCNCVSINNNGFYNQESCIVNDNNEYICKNKQMCACSGPSPFQWKDILESKKKL